MIKATYDGREVIVTDTRPGWFNDTLDVKVEFPAGNRPKGFLRHVGWVDILSTWVKRDELTNIHVVDDDEECTCRELPEGEYISCASCVSTAKVRYTEIPF